MLIGTQQGANVAFKRHGGSIIVAELDVWTASTSGWQLSKRIAMRDPVRPVETLPMQLPKGKYTCVFQCFVQESLNGIYDFEFSVDHQVVFRDSGDVNRTAAKDDTKVYRDQFVLQVN